MHPEFCPECGHQTLKVIEEIKTEDEHKWVCTCDECENIVYVHPKSVLVEDLRWTTQS